MSINKKKTNLTTHPYSVKSLPIKYIPIEPFKLKQLVGPQKNITYMKFPKQKTIKTQNHNSNKKISNQYKNINQPQYHKDCINSKTQLISQQSINSSRKKLKAGTIIEKKHKMILQLAAKRKNNKNIINNYESIQNQFLSSSRKSNSKNNNIKRCRVNSALSYKQLVVNIIKDCKPQPINIVEQKNQKFFSKIHRLKSKLDITTKNQKKQISLEKSSKIPQNNNIYNSGHYKNNLTMQSSKLNQESLEKSKIIFQTNNKNYAKDLKKKIIESLYTARTTETKYGSSQKFIERMEESIIVFHGSVEYPNIEQHNSNIKIKPIKLQYKQQEVQNQWYKKLENRSNQVQQMSPYSKLYIDKDSLQQKN